MVITALLLATCAMQGDLGLEQKVTFVCPGARVPVLVDQLSKAVHLPLSAPRAFDSDVLAVRAQDANLKELMGKIADVAAGEWRANGSGFELERSTAKLEVEHKIEYARELAMFEKAIDRQKKRLGELEPWDEKTARSIAFAMRDVKPGWNGVLDQNTMSRLKALDARCPGGRAMTRVMASLDPKILADLPSDYRIAFSDQPTRLQRRLPPAIAAALRDSIAEQDIWAAASESAFGETGPSYYSSAQIMRSRFDGDYGKTLVFVTKSKNFAFENATIQLEICDRRGLLRMNCDEQLSTYQPANPKPPVPDPSESKLVLSPFAKFLSDRAATARMPDSNARATPLPKELRDQLLDPQRFEPLGLAFGDLLVKAAEAKHCNLVAELSDPHVRLGANNEIFRSPSALLQILPMAGVDVEQSPPWIIVSRKEAAVRSERASRPELAKFLQAIDRKKTVEMDDLAAYAAHLNGFGLYDSLGITLMRYLAPMPESTGYDPKVLKFYGLLDPNQRSRLLSGEPLPLSGLSAAEADVVDHIIFGQNPNLQPVSKPGQRPEDLMPFYNGILREPTEMFGNGLPADSFLKLQQSSEAAATAVQDRGIWIMSPDTIAQRMYASERPGVLAWLDAQPSIAETRFRFGTRVTLMFNFEFGGKAQMSQSLQFTNSSSDRLLSFAELPEDFRKQVQTKLEEIRKSYSGVKPGQLGGGRTTTPPPPPPGRDRPSRKQ